MGLLFWLWVPLAIYALAPILIKFSMKTQGAPQLLAVDPAQWPPQIAETLRRHEYDLYNMGFEISDRLAMPNAMPNTSTILTMLVNRTSGEKAMITAIFGTANGITTLGTLYVEFSSRYPDGRCFDTINSPKLSSFACAPTDVKTRVPQVQNSADLLRVHRFMLRKHNAQGQPVTYPPGGARNYLLRVWREGFEEQVKFGRFQHRAGNDTFVPSWKGAYLMTWGELWPVTVIRRQQMLRRAAEVWTQVQAADASVQSPFGAGAQRF